MKWRKATPEDNDALKEYIIPREKYITSFTARAFQHGCVILGRSAMHGVFIHLDDENKIDAAVLYKANGTLCPVLSSKYDDIELACNLLQSLVNSHNSYKPYICFGKKENVRAMLLVTGLQERVSISYDSMFISQDKMESVITSKSKDIFIDGIQIQYRKASLKDLDELYPLAEDYQKTEVLTNIENFSTVICTAEQKNSIENQTVIVATLNDKIIARAQTNAKGFGYEQIGGVYVVPQFRGLGIGKSVVLELLKDIHIRNKGASLFVKKSNIVAQNTYRSLGFDVVSDYTVCYFK